MAETMSDPTPRISWTTVPLRPALIAGDQVQFDLGDEVITHVVTEADEAAGQFQGPPIPNGLPFKVRMVQMAEWDGWLP